MTEKDISKAEGILQKYKQGKANLENRIIENEQWYKLQHWAQIRSKNSGDPEPTSAWLLNCIANKHADAMDNYPAPNVLPREEGDKSDAELLSSVLPVILEQNQFEQIYSDAWWYKLKTGTGVYQIVWDAAKQNGLGDVGIRAVDLLNLFWEPGITDIQQSRNLFHVELVDKDILEAQYPDAAPFTGSTIDVAKYIYDDTVDTSEKAAVIDWYYKRNVGGKDAVHLCKFCNGKILSCSEDSDESYYDHGKYPFVFDTLFPEAGTPAGFGYIDVCKSPQIYIDKLDQVILKHSVMAARPRFFVRGDGNINEEEFADWTKDFVHFQGSGNPGDSVFPIQMPELSDMCVTVRSVKVDELKETSGNRDFSQGGTNSGVTAASAIAALQEAGSKLSRDMIKSSYRAFAQINYFCIDLYRQFCTEDRYFRIVGSRGEMEFAKFNGAQIAGQPQGNVFGVDLGYRVPIFDIEVTSQKSSPFSAVAQNELAKELYHMGFFRPDIADQALATLDLMKFEGIEGVREKIAQNGTLLQKLQQIAPLAIAMAQELDVLKGTQYTAQVAQAVGVQLGVPIGDGGNTTQTNSLGDVFQQSRATLAGNARAKAATSSTPR
jgi:hypothetical protein